MNKALFLSFLVFAAPSVMLQAVCKSGKVNHIRSESDYQEAIKSGNVIVDFYGEWCGPCKRLSPLLAELAKEFSNVIFIKVDADALQGVANQNNIRGLPTLIFFKNGQK